MYRTDGIVREAVGIFENPENLDRAVAELENTAFSREDISVLGSTAELRRRFGVDSIKPELLEDNPEAPRGISFRPEEKTIAICVIIGACAYAAGTTAAVLAGTVSTAVLVTAMTIGSLAGGLLGGGIVWFAGRYLAKGTEKQLRKGGLLLWVRIREERQEKVAQDILRKHGGHHVHVHNIH